MKRCSECDMPLGSNNQSLLCGFHFRQRYFKLQRANSMTTNSRIKAALRQLWLRSRERAEALKDQHYTCKDCGVKQSVAKGREQKVQVHHQEGVLNWDELINQVRKHLLCNPEKLDVLCKECHDKKK